MFYLVVGPEKGQTKRTRMVGRFPFQILGYCFPYLYDEIQEIAKAYDAACTPDFYLFDNNLELVYRGQMDASRPGNGLENDAGDLIHAMDCLLKKTPNKAAQKPSIGCNIKWKPTNLPS